MILGPEDLAATARGLWPQLLEGAREFLAGQWKSHRSEIIYAGVAVAWSLIRAMGKTVESGNTGLKFSFGRATREVGPGFYPLIPFLQVIRTLPTRSRTLDLPAQRVTSVDGLVFEADANLVYRVVDVHRALIEIDDLEHGMLQVLGLSVQELLRQRSRAQLYASDELDRELSARMAERLAVWGVEVERAGFPSLRPSRETVRVTQLAALGAERRAALGRLAVGGVGLHAGLVLLGTPQRILTRTRLLAERQRALRHRRRLAWMVRRTRAEIERALALQREQEGYFSRRARLAIERKRAKRAAERAALQGA